MSRAADRTGCRAAAARRTLSTRHLGEAREIGLDALPGGDVPFQFAARPSSSLFRAEFAIEICEVSGKLVAQDHLTRPKVPTRVGKATAFHLKRQRRGPRELICHPLADGFKQQERAGHVTDNRHSAFGGTINHVDFRSRLIWSAAVRLEQQIPGIYSVAVISRTTGLALLR